MQVLGILSTTIVSLTIVVALIALIFLKRFNKTQKLFVYYVFATAFFELLARFLNIEEVAQKLRTFGIENNLPGLHLFTLFQFVLLMWFFHRALESMDFHFPLRLITSFGALMIILNSIFFQSVFEFNSYSKTSVELVIILLSMVYFLKMVLGEAVKKEDRTITLFVSAIFINAALSSLLHLFSNDIMQLEESMQFKLWTFRYIVNIITLFVILFGIYIYILKKKERI